MGNEPPPWFQSCLSIAVVLTCVTAALLFFGLNDFPSKAVHDFLHVPTLHILSGVVLGVALLFSAFVTCERLIAGKPLGEGAWRYVRSWSVMQWGCCGTLFGVVAGVWFVWDNINAPLGAGPTIVGVGLILCLQGLIFGVAVGVLNVCTEGRRGYVVTSRREFLESRAKRLSEQPQVKASAHLLFNDADFLQLSVKELSQVEAFVDHLLSGDIRRGDTHCMRLSGPARTVVKRHFPEYLS
jgi:hypothetical protein